MAPNLFREVGMIHAISMTPHFDHELVAAPRHWGSRVKGFLINTLGSWRDKILTAAAVYELVQAIFLVLGGYFLAGVISAAMSALFVKTIKDLKEFANLDRATSVIKEEGYKYGLLNLQLKKNNLELHQSIERMKQENEKYGYHNLVHEALNADHRANNAVHQVNNAIQQVNNETHSLNNAVQQGNNAVHQGNNAVHQGNNSVQQGNNAVHQANNAVQQGNNAAHQATTAVQQGNNAVHQANNADQSSLNEDYRELQLQHAIMAEQLKELLENGQRGQEEALELARQNFNDYKSNVQQICSHMMGQMDERNAKAIENLRKASMFIVSEFETMTSSTIATMRETFQNNKAEIQADIESLKKEKLIFEEDKRKFAELREQFEAHILEAQKQRNEEAQGINRDNQQLTADLNKLAAQLKVELPELIKYAIQQAVQNQRQPPHYRGPIQPHPLAV